ncbi:MAG: hypothetical protein AAF741_07515 [Bacteroidota bacterium]
MHIKIGLFAFLFLLLACQQKPALGPNATVDQTEEDNSSPGLIERGPVPTTADTPIPQPGQAAPSDNQQFRSPGPVVYGNLESEPAQYASAAPADIQTLSAIMGRWHNEVDIDEHLELTPNTYSVYYEGEKVVEEAAIFHTNCPGDCTGGSEADYPCFVVASAYGSDCFGIVRLTAEEMELSLLGQSTATVLYKRQY